MSQVMYYDRISKEDFFILSQNTDNGIFNLFPKSKETFGITGAFMGIEFILRKVYDDSFRQEINELNYPSTHLGKTIDYDSIDFQNLTALEQLDLFDSTPRIEYISDVNVKRISIFLNQLEEDKIKKSYNSKELNDNGIYPRVWHDDESENLAYNLRCILDDTRQLISLFQNALNDDDYVLWSIS
jgi:hypothetical protein